MKYVRGQKRALHHVKCLDCDAQLLRGSYWKAPRCGRCRDKRWRRKALETQKLLRGQARRYRILMHALGWPEAEFMERLESAKERLRPSNRPSRYDWNTERRRKSA